MNPFMQQKFQPERSALRATFGSNAASLLIVLLFGLLIINCIFIDRGYFDALPQDLFGFLDSVYRTHLGQIPHRDFSTPQGPLYYLLPSYFISLGSNPIASIRYYHVLNLLAALGIVLYAQRTRLDGVTAVFLGALVALTLACKQLLGESPFFSTEGMFYNRIGFAFLTLELVLLLPPSAKNDVLSVVDGI